MKQTARWCAPSKLVSIDDSNRNVQLGYAQIAALCGMTAALSARAKNVVENNR